MTGTVGTATVAVGALTGIGVGAAVRTVAGRLAGKPAPPGACEAVCAAVAVGVICRTGTIEQAVWSVRTAALLLFGWWCVCASTVDLLVRRLPDVLTLGGGTVVILTATLTGNGWAASIGAAMLAAPLLVTHLISPRALGAGDVKLAVALGAVAGIAGPQAWVLSALLPPVLTAAIGLVVRVAGLGARRRSAAVLVLPHGPSMCAATTLATVVAG